MIKMTVDKVMLVGETIPGEKFSPKLKIFFTSEECFDASVFLTVDDSAYFKVCKVEITKEGIYGEAIECVQGTYTFKKVDYKEWIGKRICKVSPCKEYTILHEEKMHG